jgi:hypothetical protein
MDSCETYAYIVQSSVQYNKAKAYILYNTPWAVIHKKCQMNILKRNLQEEVAEGEPEKERQMKLEKYRNRKMDSGSMGSLVIVYW